MTIGVELAFVKILAKGIRNKFPAAWLDEVIYDLEEVTHAPAFLYSRMKHFQEKWKEMRESMNLSADSEDVKEIFQDAAMEFESYGYNLKSLYHMPETFKGFGISNVDFLVPPVASDVVGGIPDDDIDGGECDNPDGGFGDGDEIVTDDDWPTDEPDGIFEELWEMIKDLF